MNFAIILIIIIVLIIVGYFIIGRNFQPASEPIPNHKPVKNYNMKEYFTTLNSSETPIDYPQKLSMRDMIKELYDEYRDPHYVFNLANLPVTSRYPNHNTLREDQKYARHIKEIMDSWGKITVIKVHPTFIMETDDEFVVTANVSIKYQGEKGYLEVTFYGLLGRSDDILNGANEYTLQLVELRKISMGDHNNTISQTYNKKSTPWPDQKEQLEFLAEKKKQYSQMV